MEGRSSSLHCGGIQMKWSHLTGSTRIASWHLPAGASGIWKTLPDRRLAISGIVCASGIVNLLMLVAPLFMLQVYDRVLTSRSLQTLAGLLLFAVVLYVIQAVMDAIRNRLLLRFSEEFDCSIRRRIFDVMQIDAIRNSTTGGLQLSRDIDTVRGFIAGSGPIALCDLPWGPLYIAVCFLFHPLIGLAVLAGALALCAIAALTHLLTRKQNAALLDMANARRQAVEMAFRNAEALQALGMQKRLYDVWNRRTIDYLRAQRELGDRISALGSSSRFTRMLLQSGVLATGAYLVIDQQATAGVMLAATILSIRALSPIELAITNWRGFVSARESFSRLCDALQGLPAREARTQLPLPSRTLQLTSASVVIPHQPNTLVLHNINFSLNAGDALAVIGASGSGKSTLSRLLTGIWPAARGTSGSMARNWTNGSPTISAASSAICPRMSRS